MLLSIDFIGRPIISDLCSKDSFKWNEKEQKNVESTCNICAAAELIKKNTHNNK